MNLEGAFKTDDQGDLHMYGRDAFFDYFRKNPSSQFTFRIEKVAKNKEDRINAYWECEVCTKLIYGFRQTGENHNKKSVEQEMKKYCPAFHDGDNCREWSELNYFEKCRVIEEAIIFAAKDLEIVIENPR